MRYTPCGCRSAHLVEVQPNFRLLEHSTMRRAKQCRYFARSLPPRKRHSRLMTVRRGCCQITTRRDSWRSHVHRTHTAQRVQSFKLQSLNVGGRGGLPSRSLGGLRGPFSHVREWPPFPRPPHGVGDNRVHPAGAKKEAPFRVLPFYSTVTDFARFLGLSISHPRWSAI